MFEPKVVITIDLRNKSYEEAMLLEDALVNDISKYCDPKYNLKAYIHAKTFGATYKIPNATKEELDLLNTKECSFVTPKIKDYEVIINILGAIREWYEHYDQSVFGKRVSVNATFGGNTLYLYDGRYDISYTLKQFNKVKEPVKQAIDHLNQEIDEAVKEFNKSKEEAKAKEKTEKSE